MLMAGKEVPKVILYVTENGVQFVTSGFDVIRGAKLINRRMIDVEIRHGSQTDAYKEILAANKSNSSRFTDDEKRTTAYRAMDVYSDRSNTEIAELCGIEVSRIEEERKEYQKYLSRTSVNIESNTDNSQGHSPQASKSPEQTLPIHDSGGKASSGESPTEDSDGSSGPSIPAKKEVVADIGNQDSEGQSSVDETNISDMPSPSVRLFTTPQSETITALSAFETTIQKGICYDLIVIKAAASDAVKKLGAIRSILQPNACVVVRMAVSDLPQIIRSFGGHLEFVGVVGFAPPDLSDNQSEHQKLKTDFLFIKGHCKSRDRFSSVAFLGCIGNGAEQIYRYVAQVLGEDAPVKPLALSRHALNQFLMDEEGHRGHPTRKAKLAHRAWLI